MDQLQFQDNQNSKINLSWIDSTRITWSHITACSHCSNNRSNKQWLLLRFWCSCIDNGKRKDKWIPVFDLCMMELPKAKENTTGTLERIHELKHILQDDLHQHLMHNLSPVTKKKKRTNLQILKDILKGRRYTHGIPHYRLQKWSTACSISSALLHTSLPIE